jgi:anti-anti-sigma regulatory factor
MKSEALDISIVSRGGALRVVLSGPFHNEQAGGIKEKIHGLIDDGNRRFIIDMENVVAVDDAVVPMLLSLVNSLKGKGGDIKFIFRNETVTKAFAPFRNLFSIYPDAGALDAGGFFGILKNRRKLLSKKTGVRLSRPVALILLFTLAGWFLSLAFIIHLQSRRISQQERELAELTQWRQKAGIELTNLRERIRPLQQLGILKDTVEPRGHE